ncbi:uncharacterized protein LOC121288968 [Carcharodon carcharias]|uniref:uncharacterized protein LOC121288968 n=1 Tax=Carcharodon carcharias TaxID=13397 RepID=UPI001B7E73FD|nr:uncharacterized protein LOC121288968 [Carcharodon carcharias]
MQSPGGGWVKEAGPAFHIDGAGLRARRPPCFPAVSGLAAHSRNPGRWLWTGAIPWKQPSGFLAKWKKNGEELKENVGMGDTCTPAVTMETSEDVSESKSTCVPESIAMETEVTENGTIHEGNVNVTTERKYSGLNDQQQILDTCILTADPTVVENGKEVSDGHHNDNANGIKLPFKIEDLDHPMQVPLAFETMPSSYEMPEVIYAIIHKDNFKDSSTEVLGGAGAKSVAVEGLELGQDIASKPFTVTAAATVEAKLNQKEMSKAFQTTNEAENETATPAVTRSEEYSPENSSLIKLNEGILETLSEVRQWEENVENFSVIDLSKLTIESLTPLVIPQDDKGLMDLSATGLTYLTSHGNQISNESMMYQREPEAGSSAIQNEFLPGTTLMQYEDGLESAHADKFKSSKEHTNDLIHESRSNGSVTSLSNKIAFEVMELEHRSLKSNPNQNDEVKGTSNNTETRSAEQTPGQRSQTKASENVDTEHVDFAAARRQWLLLEEISKAHGHRPPVKQQKNKSITKRVTKDSTDGTSITKLIKEATPPHSASFSKDKIRSSTPVEIKIDEVECWRSLTNLNNKQDTVALQENKGAMRDFEQNLLLNIADFSACSEGSDSGLDDSTCRSEAGNLTDTIFQNETSSSVSITNGKSETPIEREIRLGVKREESLKKARGIKKHPCSEEYVEIKTRPFTFPPVPAPSAKVKNNQLAEMQMQREILLERQREEDLIQQGKIKGTSDKSLIPEIEERRKFFEQHYPFPLPSNSKMFIPHINTPASLLGTPSTMKKHPSNNEMNVGNFRLENGVLTSSEEDKAGVTDAVLKLKYPTVETANVVILETPDVVLRHSTDFALSSISSLQTEEKLQKNPFFKLRSHGSQSILSQEIREVLQREEELRKQRCYLLGMAAVRESSMLSSTAANTLPPGQKSNKNMP